MAKSSRTYRDAGVSLEAADSMVERISPLVRQTYGPRVLAAHGGFAGAFRLDFAERLFAKNYRDPVLVSCTDGVGSKVLIAAKAGVFDTIGIDLVAMSVNDMITSGAEPLFFLDYLALNKLDPAVVEQIVAGVVDGCQQAGCALLGGETAEMPDLYQPGHFDLAGFAVGIVERRRMLSPQNVRAGDDLIGLASSGIHSNGYALVRRVLLEDARLPLHESVRGLDEPLQHALLRPTRIYVRPVLNALARYRVRSAISGLAHITGSGLPGNVPRMLPPECDAQIRLGSWPIPAIFGLIEHFGVAESEMYNVFNMGVGFVLSVRPKSTSAVLRRLTADGERAFVIGRVKRGRGVVEFR